HIAEVRIRPPNADTAPEHPVTAARLRVKPTPARRPPVATVSCCPRNRIPPAARPRERCGGRRAGRACRRAATRPRPRRATTATARRSRRSTRSRRRAGGRRRGPGRWGAPCTSSRCCCCSAPSCSGSPPPPPPRFTSTDNRTIWQVDPESGVHRFHKRVQLS
uniref:Uncharacterized protein n=1 Tax=Aegilops tauschii subsp. strangulata TaxID=200361 RepID=A0A453S9S3_AEGTS